jgi:molybdopterin-guanine dinucleotide biosynthesis protein B
LPKFVAVVGGKHSGKTTVLTGLVQVFKKRGYKVATVKQMPNIETVDSPATSHDTWKHSTAGADIVVASPKTETVFFIKNKMNLNQIAAFLQDCDYVFLEGFEQEKTLAKIVAAKTMQEIQQYMDGLEIAVSGLIMESNEQTAKAAELGLPMFNVLVDAEKLADLVENKAFGLLAGLIHCGECGFPTCYDLAKALVAGDPKARGCALLSGERTVSLEVNGVKVPIKEFPRDVIKNVLEGVVLTLHGVKQIQTLTIKIENKPKD